MKIVRAFSAPALLLFASPAWAHPGHEQGVLAGLAHPWTGADHLLAMVMVGMLGVARGGRAVWAWPIAFLGAMIAGFAIGRGGVAIPLVEPMVLASVIMFGLAAATAIRVPVVAGAAMIALFGLYHGHAHAAEAGSAGAMGFAIGFLASTATLHLLGMAGGMALRQDWRRAAGGVAALAGIALSLA